MNKTLFFIFALILSLNLWASAGTGDSAGGSGRPRTVLNSSWQDVRKDPTVLIRAPKVEFDSGANQTALSIFEICLDGNQVESIKKQGIFHAMPGGNAGPAYQALYTDYLVLSVRELVSLSEAELDENNIPLYQIPIYDVAAQKRWYERKPLLVKKPYAIPECREVR